MTPPGTLSLAPMDGVTDHVYRDLLTSRARADQIGFCVSEFIRVTQRPLPASVLLRSCPEVRHGGHTRAGVPVLVQLLGGDPLPMAETARTAVELGAWGIDLNFGCPAKLVNRHDGGASLLRAPERLERVVAAVRERVPQDRPVSAKIRLGWDCKTEVVALSRAAERGGASWITIHGRTKKQMYGPPADWEAIGRARAAVGVPVVANGDLNSEEDLRRCREVSGCSHFMLGRGPMARPSVATGRCVRADGAARAVAELLLEYVELLAAAGDSRERQVGRVKQWLSLAAIVNPEIVPLFDQLKRLRDKSDVVRGLRAAS